MEYGERTQHCSPGHTAKEGPHLVRTGASRGYSRAAAPVWCCSRGIMGSSGSLSGGAREVRFLLYLIELWKKLNSKGLKKSEKCH